MLIAHYKADTRTTELTVTGRSYTDTYTNKQFHSRSPMLKLGPRPPHSILGALTAFSRVWINFGVYNSLYSRSYYPFCCSCPCTLTWPHPAYTVSSCNMSPCRGWVHGLSHLPAATTTNPAPLTGCPPNPPVRSREPSGSFGEQPTTGGLMQTV